MFLKFRRKREDQDAVPIPHRGARWYFFLLFDHFFRLMGLNILTLACCLTVVLLPAGITAACRAVLMLVRGSGGMFWEEYRAEFKNRFFAKLGIWLLMMLTPLTLAMWGRMFGLGSHITEWIIYISLLISFAAQAYFFVVIAAMDLAPVTCLTNALGLMVLEWPTTLAFIVIVVASVVLGVLLYPYSVIVLFLVFFSCTILFVCQRCLHILEKRQLLLPRGSRLEDSI